MRKEVSKWEGNPNRVAQSLGAGLSPQANQRPSLPVRRELCSLGLGLGLCRHAARLPRPAKSA